MKPLSDMTDSEREQAYPPYPWLQVAILWVGGPLALFFSGEIIVTIFIGIVATVKGWM